MQAAETHDPGGTDKSPSASGDDRDPTDPKELVDTVVRRGDLAVELHGDNWFYVLRRAPVPAGEFEFEDVGGTLTDWEECDPEADVLIVVNLDEAFETVGVDDLDSMRSAINHGRLIERARPASKLVPALDEFAEQRDRGEWNGVVDYVREGVDE